MAFLKWWAAADTARWRRSALYSLSIVALAICVAILFLPERPQPAPDVTMTSIQGEKLVLREMRGKVVLVNFWATDCTVCLAEMPAMAELYRSLQSRPFEAVFVAMPHDRPDHVLAYARREALPFKVALDVQGELVRAFGDVRVTPMTFIVDKRGHIVRRIVGEPDFDALRRFIDDRIDEAA
jgi:peroxiredoxin